MVKPIRSFLLLVYVFLILFGIMWLMPEPKEEFSSPKKTTFIYLNDTIVLDVKSYMPRQIGYKDPFGEVRYDSLRKEIVADSLYFHYFSFSEIFQEQTKVEIDIESLVDNVEVFENFDSTQLAKIDSLPLKDSVKLLDLDKILAKKMRVQYKKGQHNLLHPFFHSLGTIKNGKLVRILHYGDSQIEGDRVSSQLRNELQKKFGGCGVGMVPIQASNHARISLLATSSDNWSKELIYGTGYSKEIPKHYSLLGSYFRYNEEYPVIPIYIEGDTIQERIDSIKAGIAFADSVRKNRTTGRAWFRTETSKRTYATNRKYENYKVLYGHANSSSTMKISVEADTFNTVTLPATTGFEAMSFTPDQVRESMTFTFEGMESPNVYGVSFDCNSGIAVDNIALRGSSGLEIIRLNQAYMREQVREMNVKMVLFQFGVNTVPGEVDDYNYFYRVFSRPLRALKNLSPDMCVMVIGISDMSKQVDENFVTYPNIATIRKAQMDAAFDNGCAFFDLFEAMGGENSMPSWVAKGYAADDYTHFSSSGASIVSKMIFRALMLEYEIYKKSAK